MFQYPVDEAVNFLKLEYARSEFVPDCACQKRFLPLEPLWSAMGYLHVYCNMDGHNNGAAFTAQKSVKGIELIRQLSPSVDHLKAG